MAIDYMNPMDRLYVLIERWGYLEQAIIDNDRKEIEILMPNVKWNIACMLRDFEHYMEKSDD
jgi:hypothetical protein